MDDKELLDIYTYYLIGSFGVTTQTSLSQLLSGAINYDCIKRLLSKERMKDRVVIMALLSHEKIQCQRHQLHCRPVSC